MAVKKIYLVTNGKKKLYLPELDAREYASKGWKIKLSKLPKKYKL